MNQAAREYLITHLNEWWGVNLPPSDSFYRNWEKSAPRRSKSDLVAWFKDKQFMKYAENLAKQRGLIAA